MLKTSKHIWLRKVNESMMHAFKYGPGKMRSFCKTTSIKMNEAALCGSYGNFTLDQAGKQCGLCNKLIVE